MHSIDRELATAADSAAPCGGPPPDSKPGVAGPAPPPPKRNLGLVLGLGAVTCAVAALGLGIGEGGTYTKSIQQVLADSGRAGGRSVRVQGDLVRGSLVHQESPCEYRFRVSQGGVELPVRYAACVVPDTLRDPPTGHAEVTAEGRLGEGGTFEASNVMAKCPSKYAPPEGMSGPLSPDGGKAQGGAAPRGAI